MKISKEDLSNFTRNDFYEIAKIIDSNFIGSLNTFSYNFSKGCYYITTNKCDDCFDIKFYANGKVFRLSGDTEGYQEIHPFTYNNISKWILDNKIK